MGMQLRVLTFNISGGNTSKLAPPAFTLNDKYARVVELVQQHEPHLLALQARRRMHARRRPLALGCPPLLAARLPC
jgi:hypothetical protein